MFTSNPILLHYFMFSTTVIIIILSSSHPNGLKIPIEEATIEDLQTAFKYNKLTSRQLVQFYLKRINKLNPILRAVIEVSPDALGQAQKADEWRERTRKSNGSSSSSGWGLRGIPVLVKDNIGTKDKLNTTAGSFALLGSLVRKEAGVVKRLRKAGAIILGKASLSEWAHFRDFSAPNGWSARGGQAQNPYNLTGDPCGSSSGSAIAVAANMVSVSLGTETDGSILCPCSSNSVVGIKPTVGLTSRAGVIPISPRQDSVGPICRTVTDAAYVLDAIVGFDPNDNTATTKARKYIPSGGYTQFLKLNGLKGKRLGIVRYQFHVTTFDQHLRTLRQRGAILVDNLETAKMDSIPYTDLEAVLFAEFKVALNSYLKELVTSPVRSLADAIKFNNKFATKEKIKEYGQEVFLKAEATKGIGSKEKRALSKLRKWSKNGIERIMKENELDAIVTPGTRFSTVLAIGGFPGISVPAGYDHNNGVPFGICFGGLRGTEPKLIEIAYAFEQATKIRKPPPGR